MLIKVAMDYSLLSSMIFPTSIEFEDLSVDFPLKNHEKNPLFLGDFQARFSVKSWPRPSRPSDDPIKAMLAAGLQVMQRPIVQSLRIDGFLRI